MPAANRVTQQWMDLKPIEALEPHFLQKVLKPGKIINAGSAISQN
jgi:hypothetical protein